MKTLPRIPAFVLERFSRDALGPFPLRIAGCLLAFSAAAWSVCGAETLEKDVFAVDFEQGPDLQAYRGLEVDGRKTEASIVEGGAGGGGHVLRLRTAGPASSCPLTLVQPVTVEKNLVLEFDHREEIEPGFEGVYLGISFFIGKEQWFWTSDEFSADWRHCEVPMAKLRSSTGKAMRPGLTFTGIQIYARVKDQTAVKGETRARMSVWFDNLRIKVAPPASRLTDRSRLSWSNPPLFNWQASPNAATQRVQYWAEAAPASAARMEAEVAANFHTPAAPLEPGTYLWRVWTANELAEGWSDIERVIVPPEAHRFVTRPVPVEELAASPHPRLRKWAQTEEPNLTDARKAELVKKARKLYERGVPEHPGPHVEGDPRWPTWIEWYGKVAGGITGGTGRRLEDAGRGAMLSGDPQAISWAKELALAASGWDPDGGSAMSRGDIGAHHLLRGLSWCYDAACDSMTEAERGKVKDAIVRRGEQFHARLNPFRRGEANNHAWLQAFGLAEAGLVLLGDHPDAGDWVEYVRQLYAGRFLPCLGFQGDNNEGISYWDYGLSFVVPYADMMREICGIDLFQHPWLNQTARFPMYCAPPDAWAVSFADTGMPNHGAKGPAATRWVRALALRTRDPYALWYAGEREAVDGLMPKAPSDLPASILYRHIGVGIFNTSLVDGREGVTVAMHSGPYQAGHQHPDQNSFVIHAYGGKLAIDGGYYDWYGSPHFKEYSANTVAHNTLLVNGEGQAAFKEGADGRVLDWFDAPGYGYIVGDASDPEIYQGLLRRFERRMLFIKPGFVVVHDLVASAGEPAGYDWLLHGLAPVQVDGKARTFAIECPEAALRGRFLSPAKLSMEVTTGFPVEPVNRYSRDPVPPEKYFPEWVLHARPLDRAIEEEFCAVMQVQRLGDRPEPVARIEPVTCENGHAARITIEKREVVVLLRGRDASGPLRAGGVESDGACAVVELAPGGEVRGGFLGGGRVLRFESRDLIRREQAGCEVYGAVTK